MGILFKTYNKKHQLHLYQETWIFSTKHQLDEVFSLFSKTELVKAQVKPSGSNIEAVFNGVIMDCKDLADVKKKFAILADWKDKYQKVEKR